MNKNFLLSAILALSFASSSYAVDFKTSQELYKQTNASEINKDLKQKSIKYAVPTQEYVKLIQQEIKKEKDGKNYDN